MSYQGKYSHGRRRRSGSKAVTLLLALVLLTGAVSGTLAWLATQTDGITNTFTAAGVPNVPVEEFDGTVKKSIAVKVEGDNAIEAYVRVKLVSYRVDGEGNHIGGTAPLENLSINTTDWFEKDGYYYYKYAVKPGQTTNNLLAADLTLKQYTDADGGKQVIEVISESIQSLPPTTVEKVWPVTVVNGNLTAKGGNA